MKNLCLVIFLICLWVSDSLKAASDPDPWKQLPQRQQLDYLSSAIRGLDKNNLDSIITLSEKLRKLAEDAKDNERVAFSIRQTAWAYKHKSDLSNSIKHYFELERFYQELQDPYGLGTAYYNIGLIFAKGHEHDKALEYLELAKDYYNRAGKPYKVSLALYDMAKRYIGKKDPDTAIKLLYQALKECPAGEILHISMIHNRLGWAAKDKGEYAKDNGNHDESREYHARAREYYRKSVSQLKDTVKYSRKIAIANNNIGESHLLEGKYESAACYLQEALRIKETIGDFDFTLSTLVLLGKLAYLRGAPQETFSWLDKGLSKIDPTLLSNNVADALELVTTITNNPEIKNPIPYSTLKRYVNIQQQQFLALQGLRNNMNKYGIRAGEDLLVYEKESRALKASLSDEKFTFGGISAFLAVALVVTILFVAKKKYSKRINKILQDKEVFVRDLISEYDHKIIQLMIVKAEYEEILGKRRKNQGPELGDDEYDPFS